MYAGNMSLSHTLHNKNNKVIKLQLKCMCDIATVHAMIPCVNTESKRLTYKTLFILIASKLRSLPNSVLILMSKKAEYFFVMQSIFNRVY